MSVHAMRQSAADPAVVRRWLAILHGDSPGHVHICSTADWAGRTFTNLDAATRYVTYLDGEGREGIYARVTTIRADLPPGRRGGAADSAALPALWADLDIAGPGHAEVDLPPDEAAARRVITSSGLPEPTIWIHSGGGLYPIWLLTTPMPLDPTNVDQAKSLAKDWQAVIEHAAATLGWRYGRGVGDLARVLRIPGTVNRKEGLTRPCRIIAANPARYTFDELRTALETAVSRINPPATPARAAPPKTVDRPPGTVTPGDDYAQRTSWTEILTAVGGKEHYTQDGVTYWTRPGKPTGISASTNALGTDRLHVFTTSWPGLDGGESYSKLGAYAALHHEGDHHAAVRELARAGYGTPLPNPADEHRDALADIVGAPVAEPPPLAAPVGGGRGRWTAEVDATNSAVAADWLREHLGRDRLAGYFNRGGVVVHTPREGEDGYQPTTAETDDDDGPAQVRAVTDSALASRVTWSYGVYRLVKRGSEYVSVPDLFPRSAARTAVDAPDLMPHLRHLRGVVHSPVIRADGSILAAPGYDPGTGLLHLPDVGLLVPDVAATPTGAQVADAVALLDHLLGGFVFASKHDRAAVIGLLLTPLIRAIVPPPYQLAVITAPQPGAGKTLLVTVIRIVHGGVFRAELPGDDDELRKQITTILNYTTGSVVHFDNVTGVVRSSVVAALLTSARWDDRKLGANELISARNDRLWVVTGNNLTLGGDLARRAIRVTIDPDVPDPHLRTDFAIADLESFTREHRGAIIAALLTLVRAWIVAGRPVPERKGTDSYSHWIQTISGILANAGIEGTFANPESAGQDIGVDDEEWLDFLTAVYDVFGSESWTVKDLIVHLDNGNLIQAAPIPLDALPTVLAEKARRTDIGTAGIAKSLGRWLRNREGRWAGRLSVRALGRDRTHVTRWIIQEAKPR